MCVFGAGGGGYRVFFLCGRAAAVIVLFWACEAHALVPHPCMAACAGARAHRVFLFVAVLDVLHDPPPPRPPLPSAVTKPKRNVCACLGCFGRRGSN
jgi:hypothetical protein